jgi:Mg-chelatase subunit ChlD
MRRILRYDTSGAASTVAVFLSLLVILLFLQITLVGVIPAQRYDAEFVTSRDALEALSTLRSLAAGYASPGTTFSVTIPLGTPAVSPLAAATVGQLRFDDADPSTVTIAYRYFPSAQQAQVVTLDQDIILLMDSSGSMVWNDPGRLRISGAKEYLGSLRHPDRIAIVDFDNVARFVRANVGGPVHHLNQVGHNGLPDYSEPQSDLDTIDQSGATNFGDAIRIANDEFRAYGDRKQEWVMILLTDGRQCCTGVAARDAMALSESLEAATLGITIYTIGLGSDLNEPLLRAIAANTGGTYYHASNAAAIRWIYFEISRRYTGAFLCGNYAVQESGFGSLTLNLQNREYPAQTIRMEGASVAIMQSDGAAMQEGLPVFFTPTGPGTGALSMTVVTFIGPSFSAAGFEPQVIQARTEVQDLSEHVPARVALDAEGRAIGNISAYLQYWAAQGAATASGAAAIQAPLTEAEDWAYDGDEEVLDGDLVSAKFAVDRASTQLAAAIASAEQQAAAGQVQNWLATSTRDQILASACRLEQWRSWYDGITLTMTTPIASSWALWFQEKFATEGADIGIAASGDTIVVSFHAIDSYILDRRVVRLALYG